MQTHTQIDNRLHGSRKSRILLELFGNTLLFPVVNIFLELLSLGAVNYFSRDLDAYALIVACLIQATLLGHWQYQNRPQPFLGNLIAPTIYTVVEVIAESYTTFFSAPNHIAFWIFALLIGSLQSLQLHLSVRTARFLLIIESIVKVSILPMMYWIFSSITKESYANLPSLQDFFSEPGHLFLTLTTLLMGLMLGMAKQGEAASLQLLRETSQQLRCYSEWLLGKHMLALAVDDPSRLGLARQERTVLFMDIRGFTRWSEAQTPEQVVTMLNAYCETAERCWQTADAIKVKLTGDEIMIVFQHADSAFATAQCLAQSTMELLKTYQLAAGIGLHCGALVEGLIGSQAFKTYDVIGDTVNTAKRICDHAQPHELLISEKVLQKLTQPPSLIQQRSIQAKGKTDPITVFAVELVAAGEAIEQAIV